ncbi:hypothetical protein PILCRDRAFT_6974 [Piloderma croceum F 1598]|uniref:Uncharacterized protein n=1 Tax=Piloderma croceum (strain F 1598) TaxID=765440 RepID=A0A0C3FZ16_PILCF|nr:hypothetical protein PILCRDRAFT_6974 [Piloderma croceum F 1598]
MSTHKPKRSSNAPNTSSYIDMDDKPTDDDLPLRDHSPQRKDPKTTGMEEVNVDDILLRYSSSEDKDTSVSLAMFRRDRCGDVLGSPTVQDECGLEPSPRSTNPPSSRIRQPRRPNTSSNVSSNSELVPMLFISNQAPCAYHQPSHSVLAIKSYP